MAGVGKSALAIRVAHQLKAQFPGGQIYLNLRGADTHPLTVESALETLLQALGIAPAQIPPELADRTALYRSRLAELHKAQSPVLILLDNAANPQQVQDLLPGSGACLITSRRQLDGLAGMKPLNLEALSPEQALELLEKLLPEPVQRETEAARAIVGLLWAVALGIANCRRHADDALLAGQTTSNLCPAASQRAAALELAEARQSGYPSQF